MLDRFIVPASRLSELPPDAPRLSVVLDGGEGDLEAVADARRHDVELVEARIDPSGSRTRRRSWTPSSRACRAFWELSPGRGLRGAVAAVREAGAGAKIRCGGATASRRSRRSRRSWPPAATPACPSRPPPACTTRSAAATAHGFLNLLAAAVFAHADGDLDGRSSPRRTRRAFTVDAARLRRPRPPRRTRRRSPPRARELFVAYGSCSFSEPVEDLVALGLL